MEKSDEDDGGGKSVSANFGPEIHTLRQQIKDFLALKVAYTIKRMLAADLTNLYTGTQIKRDDVNKDSYPLLGYLLDQPEIQQDASFGVSKGGIRLQPFFTYNWYALEYSGSRFCNIPPLVVVCALMRWTKW